MPKPLMTAETGVAPAQLRAQLAAQKCIKALKSEN